MTHDGPRGSNRSAPTRVWPPHESPEDPAAVETTCARCDQPWRVHRDLAGYRLRCVCGGWVRVPYPETLIRSARDAAQARVAARQRALPTGAEPGANGAEDGGRLRTALVASSFRTAPEAASADGAPNPDAREIDRGLLELIAIGIAFLVPSTVVGLTLGPEALLRWLPLVSLVGGVLVMLVGFASGQFGFEGLRGARPRAYVEALGATAACVGLALGWTALLESATDLDTTDALHELTSTLGIPLALFCIALCPAVFEEIAFRGIIQGRMIGLLGTRSGWLVTAVLFTVAHGVSAVSPLHLVIGLLLGGLRLRSGSLFPGMLLHGLYNGAIVLGVQEWVT